MKHRETIMMTSCETDIFGTGILDNLYPFGRIEIRRIETRSRLGILILIELSRIKIPFSLCIRAVNAPMDKDTEALGCKHLTCGKILGRRNICVLRTTLGRKCENDEKQ